jgi:PAS domain-containing protein
VNDPVVRTIARPGTYGFVTIERLSTIAILVSALCCVGSIVSLGLTSTTIARSQNAAYTNINESERAAELSQRVIADVLGIASSHHDGTTAIDIHADLNFAATSLDASLAKLDETAPIPAKSRLDHLRSAWSPIRRKLAVIGNAPGGRGGLDRIVDRTLGFSAGLGQNLALAHTELALRDAASEERTKFWRDVAATIGLASLAILAIGIAIRFGYTAYETKRFAAMLERIVGDLAKSSLRLTRLRRRHEIIMEAAGNGMFVLGRDLRVKPPFARELCAIFHVEDVAGRSVHDLLAPYTGDRELAEIDGFLSLLFRGDISDEELDDHHPLREFEIPAPMKEATGVRYLSFIFRRMRESSEIVSVFVSVNDVTERVRLAHELQISERKRDRQQAMLELTSNLSSERLSAFAIDAHAISQRMDAALRPEDMALAARGYVEILRERLGSLALAAERLKRLTHAVGYQYLFELANTFEKRVTELRRATYIDGDAFLAIVAAQTDLREEIDRFAEFRQTYSGRVAI